MPYNGPIPFLLRFEIEQFISFEVSMPYNGPIPFLQYRAEESAQKEDCVNAL